MPNIKPHSRAACDELDCKNCEIANGTDEEAICFHSGKLAEYYGTLKEWYSMDYSTATELELKLQLAGLLSLNYWHMNEIDAKEMFRLRREIVNELRKRIPGIDVDKVINETNWRR